MPRWAGLLIAPRVFRAPEAPAAREARRPHFVRRRASKPARALRTLRRPPHQWCLVADVWLCASSRSPARPRHRPRAPQPGPAAPCGCHGASRVVTNVVNPGCFSCGFLPRCYKRRQFNGFFAENAGFWAWIDDVCNGYCPRMPWTGPATAHGRCGQALPTRRPGCLKPPSPLRARNRRFGRVFRMQR